MHSVNVYVMTTMVILIAKVTASVSKTTTTLSKFACCVDGVNVTTRPSQRVIYKLVCSKNPASDQDMCQDLPSLAVSISVSISGDTYRKYR